MRAASTASCWASGGPCAQPVEGFVVEVPGERLELADECDEQLTVELVGAPPTAWAGPGRSRVHVLELVQPVCRARLAGLKRL